MVLAGSQTGCGSPQIETSLAVNPANPRNLVVGINDHRVFNTREPQRRLRLRVHHVRRQRHLNRPQLPHLTFQAGALPDMDSAGGPAIAFGPNQPLQQRQRYSQAIPVAGD